MIVIKKLFYQIIKFFFSYDHVFIIMNFKFSMELKLGTLFSFLFRLSISSSSASSSNVALHESPSLFKLFASLIFSARPRLSVSGKITEDAEQIIPLMPNTTNGRFGETELRSRIFGAVIAPTRAIIEQAPIPVFRIEVGKSSDVYK
ncbi:hypothetical protein BpHYR1_028868 [Brachionus plicatilis]|uniref:Uncharacterized protein n=1 Tax=Brachionus plicatilis TaxID=10195 RepID=A0A3M7T6W2_BRAPC|nr:hypothetical protein BpHYR1_028868 [Brachionus plicatilis]